MPALYYAFALRGPVTSRAVTPWWNAVFHSVSAYANAGFSLYDAGFVPFAESWSVSSIIMALIILGGLGVRAVDEARPNRKASLVPPSPEHVIREGDTLMLVGEGEQIERFVGQG